MDLQFALLFGSMIGVVVGTLYEVVTGHFEQMIEWCLDSIVVRWQDRQFRKWQLQFAQINSESIPLGAVSSNEMIIPADLIGSLSIKVR